jgi:hypothetical protein
LHTLILQTQSNPNVKETLEKYKKYFSKAFYYEGNSIVEALKLHANAFKRCEAFFIIDADKVTLTDKQWKTIIIQSILNVPIIFVKTLKLTETIVYKNKNSDKLREVFEYPEFMISSGIYIANPKLYKYLDEESTIDNLYRKWIKERKKGRRGSRETGDVLVCQLPEDTDVHTGPSP